MGPARSGALPAYWFAKLPNLGDAVAPILLEHVSGVPPVRVSHRYRGKVVSIGSVLDRVRRGDVVWGTGALRREPHRTPGVTFLAVRGPLTRELVQEAEVPEVYGDPAMLLPQVHRGAREIRYEVGLVPHYADHEAVRSPDPAGVPLIDVTRPWREVVDRITACQVILSSSLHGIVVAEAYGIPAVWVAAEGRLVGGDFKFRDYYLGTGREAPEPARWSQGVARALERTEAPPSLDSEPLVEAWRQWAGPPSG